MVDREHGSRAAGGRSRASLNSGSARRPVAPLPSAQPAAIISRRKRMMSAGAWTVRPGSRGVVGAGRQPPGDPQAALDPPRDRRTAIGGRAAAVEAGDDGLPGDR